MVLNPLILAASALVPLVIGSVWYHPKVLGNAWMQSANLNEADTKNMNIALIMGLGVVLNFLMAISLNFVVIHQNHVFSLVANMPEAKDPNSEVSLAVKNFIAQYGQGFRTFKHGAFHGLINALFFLMPVIATQAMYEKKNWKYVLINVGYWAVSLAVMGGIICQFS